MPKNYDFIFSSKKCRHDFVHTLYYSATMVSCTGMKTKEHLIQKNRKKRRCKFFGVQYFYFSCYYLTSFKYILVSVCALYKLAC